MKTRLALATGAALLMLSAAAPAFAFQCPSDVAKIDAALESSSGLSAEQRAEAQRLRDEGQRLHQAGQHQEAVDTLAQAKEMLGVM